MEILLIVIDGLGDRSIPLLGNKTPLEAAKTPNLDFLAKNGICGLVLPFKFPQQENPESDTCHLALFGCDPKIYYLGRGPYEVAGIGMDLKKGDIALRMNFGTVDENFKVIDRRAGRISQTQSLIKSILGIEIDGVKFLIKKSYGHRAGLVLRGKNLSGKISDGDPHEGGVNIKKIVPLIKSKKAKFTAAVLNKFLEKSHLILKNHPLNEKRKKQGSFPANYLLVRGAGEFKKNPTFKQKYGFRACCIAGGGLYKGIAKILGMDLINVKGATGLPNTNLKEKISATQNTLKDYDFIFLHIKAADSLAEDGNFKGKKEFIEKIDKNLKPLLNFKNVLIVVTADHSTCSLLKRHCSEPIPILIYGTPPTLLPPAPRAPGKNGVQKFSEKACQKGKLGKINQLDLMQKILGLARS